MVSGYRVCDGHPRAALQHRRVRLPVLDQLRDGHLGTNWIRQQLPGALAGRHKHGLLRRLCNQLPFIAESRMGEMEVYKVPLILPAIGKCT